jgi:TPR repeat protein
MDGPAYNAGMKINDKIVSIDEKKIKSALNAVEFIENSKSEIIEIVVLRNNQEVKLNVRPLIIGYGSEGDILMSGKKTKKRRIGVNWLSACSNPGDWKKNKNECWIDFKSRQLDYLNTLTKSSQYYNDYISYKTEALMSLGYHEIKRKNFSNAINFYESAYNLAVEIDDIIQSTKITSIVSWMGQKEKVAYTLGELYLNVGGVRDYDKAVKYLTIASEDVYKAWRDLGLMYLEGRGVKLDEKKAFELLKKSSTHGSGFEHVYVGDFYLLGLGGQKKNLSKALRHFKLAELGSRGTVNFSNIEVLYKYKRLPQNSDEFYSWLLENIEKNSNSVPSMERLGYFSNTILKNYPEAYKWYYICSKAEFNEEEIFVGQANIEVPEIKKRCFNKLDILETDYLSNYNMEQAKIAADKWTNKYMN